MKTFISGVEHVVALMQVPGGAGTLLVATPLARIDRLWRDEVSLNVTLFAGISAILLVVLYAYYIQAKRARDADQIFAESNLRVETALSRGRCGLWDFDMPNRRLFWSRSMYEMLGMPPRADVLSFGDAARLMHPDDSRHLQDRAHHRQGRCSGRSTRSSACAMPAATMSGCAPAPR